MDACWLLGRACCKHAANMSGSFSCSRMQLQWTGRGKHACFDWSELDGSLGVMYPVALGLFHVRRGHTRCDLVTNWVCLVLSWVS